MAGSIDHQLAFHRDWVDACNVPWQCRHWHPVHHYASNALVLEYKVLKLCQLQEPYACITSSTDRLAARVWAPRGIKPLTYLSVLNAQLVPYFLCWCPHCDWVHHISTYPVPSTDVVVLLYDEGPNTYSCQVPARGKTSGAGADDYDVRIRILPHGFIEHVSNGSCDLFLAHVSKYLCHMRYPL